MTNRHSSRAPRVLYLAFYLPPSRASGVFRARATANHLAAQGWDVTAFAAPLDFLYSVIGTVDEQLAETLDPRVAIERPKQKLFAWERDIRQFSTFRRNYPLLARKLYEVGQRLGFPEHYASWGRSAVRLALRRHLRERFDVVLATGNPFASLAAAWTFHRLTGVPYVVDYRDSWTLNLFTDAPAYEPGHPAWGWERRILRDASGAVFVNNALRSWHASRYPDVADRMMVVPNGWDPELMGAAATVERAAGRPARPLRFAYVGTVSGAQPVEELVAAFDQARTHPDLVGAQLNIHGHLGFFRGSQTPLAQRLGLEDDSGTATDTGVHYRGPVSKVEVSNVYANSDVLVFLAGGARYVTSGKIFEYMATGMPIVSVHAPGIAATEVLDGYPLWFNANSLDVDELAQSMVAAGKAARDMTPEVRAGAQRHADAFRRDLLLAPLEQRLRELVRHPIPEEPAVDQ